MDAAETVSTFMVNDLPDPETFLKATGDLIAKPPKRLISSLPALQLAFNVRPFFGHKARERRRFGLNICGTR